MDYIKSCLHTYKFGFKVAKFYWLLTKVKIEEKSGYVEINLNPSGEDGENQGEDKMKIFLKRG